MQKLSDEFVVPQPNKPAVTFRLRNVEYELHADGEYVEISQNGTSIARLPCTNREYSVFTGITHVYKDCFYFLLGEGKWKKLALFNPQSHFTLGNGAIFNPHFKDGFLISVTFGDRDTRFQDVIYKYALLQGQCLLQKEEHYITDAQGFRCKTVALTEREKQPFK